MNKISEQEILALKAVCLGCEKNTKLMFSTYFNNDQKIGFGEAVGVVRGMIIRLKGADNG